MKFWVLKLGVCLFVAQGLFAQYAGSSNDAWNTVQMQKLQEVAQEFSFGRLQTPVISSTHMPDGDAVVSLQGLSHKTSKQARQLYKKGMQAYGRKHYEQSAALLQKAAVVDPQSSAIQNNLGVVYCLLGQPQKAQEAFQNSVTLDNGSALSYVNLAAVAFSTYQYPLAAASARQALRIAPLSPGAGVMLGLAEVAQDHWTREARKLLEANRAASSQAELVLQHWPSADEQRSGLHHTMLVHSAGPAALRGQ